MTPKEKAQDLVEKFDECLNHLTSGTNGIEVYIRERAVSCALIAVQEILSIQVVQNGYWGNVKKEIENL